MATLKQPESSAVGSQVLALSGNGLDSAPGSERTWLEVVKDYASIGRPDHWGKNIFMVVGVLLALFYHPDSFAPGFFFTLAIAVFATCLIASSNYTLNEILDAPTDCNHPSKMSRPIPSGRVQIPVAYVQWIVLGAAGLALASLINAPFFWSGVFLLVMGLVYNVPPVRSKEIAYIDVLSESINNPIRLLLGWFAVTAVEIPPVSLLASYWMIGAFFMGAKRLAEYRFIGDGARAAAYRSSFRHYNEARLLVSLFFYVTCFSLFLGVFIIRYHLELILIFPLVAGFICYYAAVTLREDSAAQKPEKLYRETGLMLYLVLCVVAFSGLMFVQIPVLYEVFNVQPSPVSPLWKI
jgi:4-hydroxybenzoate polyprenyltransferase